MPADTREGVLIKASVRYWRGCKKLEPDDLVLKKETVSEQLISLSHKCCFPKMHCRPWPD